MQVQVMIFGQLTDITGKSELMLYDIPDTDTLIRTLQSIYPALSDTKFAIALNKKVIRENTLLEGDNNIALLPPFSGG
jgi:molybdopterin converting factor small subunit